MSMSRQASMLTRLSDVSVVSIGKDRVEGQTGCPSVLLVS